MSFLKTPSQIATTTVCIFSWNFNERVFLSDNRHIYHGLFLVLAVKGLLNLILLLENCVIYNYVWIYENRAKELNSRAKRAFSSRQSDDIKIKRRVSPFSFPVPVYVPFIVLLSLFFCPLTWLGEGLKG